MKTINRYIALVAILAILISGCKKKFDDVSEVVEVTYPGLVLNGAAAVQIPVGGTYTDEGATLTDDISGAVSQVTATINGVDASTPGIYPMIYTAANANGFKTTVTRNVLVLDYTPPSGVTINLEGLWERTATGAIVTYTKVNTGLYVLDKVGGSTSVPAYMMTPTDTTIDIPEQQSYDPNGAFLVDVINETLILSPDTTITYNVVAEGFGGQNRSFTKIQ